MSDTDKYTGAHVDVLSDQVMALEAEVRRIDSSLAACASALKHSDSDNKLLREKSAAFGEGMDHNARELSSVAAELCDFKVENELLREAIECACAALASPVMWSGGEKYLKTGIPQITKTLRSVIKDSV